MAHVIGIGTFWEFLVVDENLDYYGPKATNVWQNDWGCVGTPPVEKDFGPGTRGNASCLIFIILLLPIWDFLISCHDLILFGLLYLRWTLGRGLSCR